MSHSNPFDVSLHGSEETSRYRIMCRRADGSVGLIRLCRRFGEACRIARSSVDRHLAKLRADRLSVLLDSARPREVFVEKWVGTLVEGHWVIVEPQAGGYGFEFFDSPPRTRKPGEWEANQSIERAGNQPSHDSEGNGRALRAGELVECVLLEKRTRKNGWFARLIDHSASGPVTGPAPQTTKLEPGQSVRLKLCGLKLQTGFAQFAWAARDECSG